MVISMSLRNCHTSLKAPMITADFRCPCVGKIVKGVNIQHIHLGKLVPALDNRGHHDRVLLN